METTKEDLGFFNKIRPPLLEEAGLDDSGLPLDSIKEAFVKAATAVSSRVAAVLSSGESEGECVNDPFPGERSPPPSDALVGSEIVGEAPGPCAAKKGGPVIGDGDCGADLVGGGDPEGREDVIVGPATAEEEGGEGEACVDGTSGLEIGGKKEDRGREGEGPTLVEGFV